MLAMLKKLVAAPPVSITPTPITAPKCVMIDDEYRQLSEKLGVTHLMAATATENKQALFIAALAEMGLRQYDPAVVKAYLNTKYTEAWGFRALRQKDYERDGHGYITRDSRSDNRLILRQSSNQSWDSDRAIFWAPAHNGFIIGGQDRELYSKPVPMPVLLTVQRIVEKFPEAKFYVSDKANVQIEPRDPFLLVVHLDQQYIIERWDEPSFRG